MIIGLFSLGVMVEALRPNIDWKPPFLKWVGQFGPKFQVEGGVPHQTFVHGQIASECLTTLQPKVFTQRNFVADFL